MAIRIYTDNGCDLDKHILDELGVGFSTSPQL